MKQSPGKQIRIVEVGGGTGGTTTSLLPVLPGERTDYRFTDVSEYFFKQAEQKFEQYPFIRYGLMDIEKDPEEQGYNAHNFDFVIGANVFHATKNLDKALMHARSLLAPGGMLLLYETTAQPTWFETSIGLIEGWSRFDDEWRRDIPLLSAQRWAEALQANGFVSAASWPRPGMVTEVLGSHILLAQAPLEIEFDPTAENQISNGKRAATSRTPSTTQYEEPKINEAATILLQQLAEATSEERQLLLIDYVRDQIMRVTRSDASNPPDRRQRLMDFGVDSLMAVDLRNRLSKGIGLTEPLPATLIFDYPTIERIAGYLEGKIKEENGTLPSNTSLTDISSTANNIAELSDEEVEKLLMKKLGDMS
jgi:SAM-dependent methyltransferase